MQQPAAGDGTFLTRITKGIFISRFGKTTFLVLKIIFTRGSDRFEPHLRIILSTKVRSQ